MTCTLRPALVATIGFVGALLLLTGPGALSRSSHAAAGVSLLGESLCTGSISGSLSAPLIRDCETTTVTVSVGARCPPCSEGAHVVFLLAPNVSEIGVDGWLRGIAQDVVSVLEDFHKDTGAAVRAGVVAYAGDYARTLVPLTDRLDTVPPAVLRSLHGSLLLHYTAARAAMDMLREARGGGRACEFVVWFVFDDRIDLGGFAIQRRKSLEDSIQQIQRSGITLMLGCPHMGDQAYRCETVEVLSQGAAYAQAPDRSQWGRTVVRRGLRDRRNTAEIGTLDLFQLLPAELPYSPDSAVPPAAALAGGDGTLLRWSWSGLAASQTHTVTYRLGGEGPEGSWPITGRANLTDTFALTNVLAMAPLTATRQGACLTRTAPSPEPTPTETGVPPSPTATPIATPTLPPPTSTPTACATPTATATRVPAPAYLPLALREEPCVPEKQRVDVALVIDASTSMDEETRPGWSKLDAARDAVGVLLGELRLDVGNQAAIVTFNAEAQVLQALTSDRSALDRAMAGFQTAPQTRIHRGIEAARLELASTRHRAASAPAMVVLTDGRANPDGPEVAVAEAALAKEAGITVFTIGLGADVDFDALERMASKPAYFYCAPGADELAAIYAAIARLIPCPAEMWWGGRP